MVHATWRSSRPAAWGRCTAGGWRKAGPATASPAESDRATTEDPATTLPRLTAGVWTAQAVAAAAELGIADCLANGPKAVEARETGTHAPSLRRLLRALAGHGIFAEDGQGRYGLTPLAGALA
jgi:hypothetical protein